MKTSVVDIGGLFSAPSARGVEMQLAKLSGVHRFTMPVFTAPGGGRRFVTALRENQDA